jgi:uncharacterized membrane protein
LNPEANELEALRSLVRQLAQRVEALEQRLDKPRQAVPSPPSLAAATAPVEPTRTISSFSSEVTSVPPPPAPPRPPKFHREAPSQDLESRIGSHWLNRIGITAVLIGVSYFLKYAFDNNWIGASGRIGIGLLAGIAIVAWSERFRSRGYRAF